MPEVEILSSGTKVDTVCTQFLLVLGHVVHCFVLDVLTAKLNFKMASAKAKWSDHLHSYIPGTQCVKPTPFCAGN